MLPPRAKLERALELARELKRRTPWTPLPGPQTLAFHSDADVIGYGGAAGGGKTDLICGLALAKHRRVVIIRREKAQTEGIVQRLTEIIGSTNGYNSQKSVWKTAVGASALIEFGGLDNPGDERRWQGRAHDLKAFDEATEMREAQVRFIMGWTRTRETDVRSQVLMTFNPPTTSEGRWVIPFFAPWLDRNHPNPAAPGELRWFTTIGDNEDCEVADARPFVLDANGEFLHDFDPDQYPPEDILTPKSRTFIPAKVTDNIYYLQSGYISQLQALPEPLRSQMLYGDFSAGIEDDPWQVIPSAWVAAAQARWTLPDKLPPMDSLGVDVARGGKDRTILIARHGMWFNRPLVHPGSQTPDGPTVAGLAVAAARNHAVIHIDVIGVGASPYDFLLESGQQVIGVNVAEAATRTDKSGRIRFKNLRSALWWQLREALDPDNNTGIALPPLPEITADLTAPKWRLSGAVLQVESREDIVARIGRSPDYGSAIILALIDTPKSSPVAKKIAGYDPYSLIQMCT
jgi:hypothetical protein